MIIWSVVIGILGVGGTGLWMRYHPRQGRHYEPQWYWFVGLAALLPAWFLAFLGLLGSSPPRPDAEVALPLSALFSSAAGLLGAVFTDATVRRLQASGRAPQPLIYWLLGMLSLVPAWCIALIVLLRRDGV